MRLEVETVELSASGYFNILDKFRHSGFRKKAMQVFWVEPPGLKMRLVALIAPMGFCWGFGICDLLNTEKWSDWATTTMEDVTVFKGIRSLMSNLQIPPRQVPYSVFKPRILQLRPSPKFGAGVPDLPLAWIHCLNIPPGDLELQDLLNSIDRYAIGLPGLFLFPEPGLEVDKLESWAMSVHPQLDLMFGCCHGAPLAEELVMPRRKEALEHALAHVDAAQAREWLTPSVLWGSFIGFSYPMEESMGKLGKRVAELDAALVQFCVKSGAPPPLSAEAMHGAKLKLAILRAKLLNKWGWPTMVSTIREYREIDVLKDSIFRKGKTSQELESEADKILETARVKYPVLFEREVYV